MGLRAALEIMRDAKVPRVARTGHAMECDQAPLAAALQFFQEFRPIVGADCGWANGE